MSRLGRSLPSDLKRPTLVVRRAEGPKEGSGPVVARCAHLSNCRANTSPIQAQELSRPMEATLEAAAGGGQTGFTRDRMHAGPVKPTRAEQEDSGAIRT